MSRQFSLHSPVNQIWRRYFREYRRELKIVKNNLRLRSSLTFNCNQCGLCCNFTEQSHRCLLSVADLTRWRESRFRLGLMLLVPVQSIDGFAAWAIPTKEEIMDGTFIASIAPLDDSNRYLQNWGEVLQALEAFLRARDTELSETGNCLFLGTDNRCLIHPIRPGACHLFPYLQQGIVSYANDLDSLIDPRADVPCSPECFE
ncbi:MAG TPA: YkgJ family cysteine cluster protein, partial [Candidatus Lokiarchaeia archaeon]|nr:YkgJ family cysteine cluster protein [Candidatus Lokiarchaeia archaeon]